jgi:hypothetical protein
VQERDSRDQIFVEHTHLDLGIFIQPAHLSTQSFFEFSRLNAQSSFDRAHFTAQAFLHFSHLNLQPLPELPHLHSKLCARGRELSMNLRSKLRILQLESVEPSGQLLQGVHAGFQSFYSADNSLRRHRSSHEEPNWFASVASSIRRRCERRTTVRDDGSIVAKSRQGMSRWSPASGV